MMVMMVVVISVASHSITIFINKLLFNCFLLVMTKEKKKVLSFTSLHHQQGKLERVRQWVVGCQKQCEGEDEVEDDHFIFLYLYVVFFILMLFKFEFYCCKLNCKFLIPILFLHFNDLITSY